MKKRIVTYSPYAFILLWGYAATIKLWTRILIWLLPIAFVWLSLLGIDHTLYIPLMTGVLTLLHVNLSISDYRMRYAVFQPIAGYEY